MQQNYITLRLTEKRKRWIAFLAKHLELDPSGSPGDVIDFALSFAVLLANQFHLSRKESHNNNEQE